MGLMWLRPRGMYAAGGGSLDRIGLGLYSLAAHKGVFSAGSNGLKSGDLSGSCFPH